MSALYEHPSLKLYVTPDQRERAEQWLQEAYADGRITEDEFDRRIGQVISSTTRKDLNEAFFGLVQVPMASTAMGVHQAYPPVRPGQAQQGRAAAGLAHLSSMPLPLVGPAVFYGLSEAGSYPRREAAKAFNFQLIALLSGIVAIIANGATRDHLGWLVGLVFLGWFVLTLVGAGKAFRGESWRNPVKSVLRLEVLPER